MIFYSPQVPQVSLGNIYCLLKYVINVCYILDQLDVYVLTIYFNACSLFSNLQYCSFNNQRTHKIKEKLDNAPYVRILNRLNNLKTVIVHLQYTHYTGPFLLI